MARIDLGGGRWVDLRPMRVKDEVLIGKLARFESTEDKDDKAITAYFELKLEMLEALDAATLAASWEGGFGELPKGDLLTALFLWNGATEEEALPEGNAPNSETPSEPGR